MRPPRSNRAALSAVLLGCATLSHPGSASAQNQQYPVPLTITYDQALHIANRLSFGASPSQLTPLVGPVSNALSYISGQLAPNFTAEDLAFAPYLAAVGAPVAPIAPAAAHDIEQTQRGVIVYAALSEHQLAARMAYFWLRHFNAYRQTVEDYVNIHITNFDAVEAASITSRLFWKDFDFFRRNGLGSFRALAGHAFFSPTMLIYLDTVANKCSASTDVPNQNEARETLELETIGPRYVPGAGPASVNYSEFEIDEIARAMSGWGIQGTGYAGNELTAVFRPNDHCNTTGVNLFRNRPQIAQFAFPTGANPADHVNLLLDHLVASEACKDFICRKLMTEFLGDGTDAVFVDVLADMKSQWGATGDLDNVLGVLFSSGEFLGAHTRWERAKTPFEITVSHARMWDASFTTGNPPVLEVDRIAFLRDMTRVLGERTFEFPSPDGFPLESRQQIGSGITLLTTNRMAEAFFVTSTGPHYDYDAIRAGETNAFNFATTLLTRAFGSELSPVNPRGWTSQDRTTVIDALEHSVNGTYTGFSNLTPSQYQNRVAIALTAIMSMNKGRLR